MVNSAKLSTAIALVLLIAAVSPSVVAEWTASSQKAELQLRDYHDLISILNRIDLETIRNHVSYFSSLGSRVLGYPGCDAAARYIINYFNRTLGLKVLLNEYVTAVPIDEGSSIIVPSLNTSIEAYALWPRGGVQEQVGNVAGQLYYIRNGEWEDIEGIDLSNAIVVMEFNSGKNWLRAVSLGAKGVVFLGTDATDKFEALAKGTSVPLNVPLLYVDRKHRDLILKLAAKHEKVILSSRLRWHKVTGRNIVAILPGESTDDVIIVSAHYDSWSIVPAKSPAAEESLSISILLEIARAFSESKNKFRRTIWFVAYSGIWEGLIGPVEFVENVIFNTSARVWLQIDLDISTETPFLDAMFFNIIPYTTANALPYFSSLAARFAWIQTIATQELSRLRVEALGLPVLGNRTTLSEFVRFNFFGYYWGTQPDLNYMLACIPFMQTSGMAFTVRTQYARRNHWFTPVNDLGLIRWENVKPQAYVVAALAYVFANYDDYGVSYDTIRPRRLAIAGQAALGYATLYGKTVEFSYETGWYKPVPNVLVRLRVIPYDSELTWPFAYRYAFSDANGSFVFHGLGPLTPWSVDAWKLDESGNIIYFVDFGYMGTSQGIAGGISTSVYVLTTTANILVPLFRGGSLTIFDVWDAERMLRAQVPDIRSPNRAYVSLPLRVSVFDAATRAVPMHYFYASDPINGLVVVAASEQSKILVTIDVGSHAWPTFLFVNSTRDNPEGGGILVAGNRILYRSMEEAVRNLLRIVDSRYRVFRRYDIRSPYLEYVLENANKSYISAVELAKRYHWASYFANLTYALNLLYKGYAYSLMPLYNEAAISMVILAFFIIPVSMLFERVLIRQSSWKRILSIIGLAILIFTVFGLVHPALSLMANSAMAVFGIGIALLALLAMLILSREAEELIRRMKTERIGFHEYRTEAVAAALYTVETAAENMRYRPLRTALAIATITIITAGLTSLTSTTYTYSPIYSVSRAQPLFEGLLLRIIYGFPHPTTGSDVLDLPRLEFLRAAYSGSYVVSPRVWCYPTYVYPTGDAIIISREGDYGRAFILTPAAIMGLAEEEIRAVLSKYFVTGLANFGENSIIVPEQVAKALNLTVGDTVFVWGFGRFRVAGVVAIRETIFDNNGYPWLPIDPGFSTALTLAGFTYPAGMDVQPLLPSNVIFVHWRAALKFGGFVSSIALLPKAASDANRLQAVAIQLADTLPLGGQAGISVALQNEVHFIQWIFSVMFTGGMYLFVDIIAILTVLNFMMGIVQERKREISTYQALGLSPRGAIILFSTEAAVIALSGVLMGYLLGLAMNRAFIRVGVLPPDFSFNFVSLALFITLILIVGSVIAASLYPAYLASRLVTPSYERKWRPDTRPQGGQWTVNLPLSLPRDEAAALLRYLREFFSEEGFAGPGYKVLEIGEFDEQRAIFTLRVMLTPEETGVVQDVTLYARPLTEGRYGLVVHLKHVIGDLSYFEARNYRFLNVIRKQLLLWTSLPRREKQRYFYSSYS